MTDAHLERSRLVNDYKTQLRTLQKTLKKKKLPQKQKEEVEQQIEELEKKYEAQISEFDAIHGVEIGKKKTATDDHAESPPSEPTVTEHALSSRNWGGLSKKELEECCQQRGLSRKGAKEQLISRLTIWSVGHGQNPHASTDNDPNEIHYETFNPVNVISTGAKKDEFREKRKKLWKRRSAGPAREGPKSSDEEESSESDESDQESGDEPRERRVKKSAPVSESSDEEKVDHETLQKQRKREAVVAAVLKRILEKYKSGVKLSDICDKLKEFKVANFTPQLLGYETLEDWIEGQPRTLLTYKAKTQLILPSVVGAMPDSDDESDDEDVE